ncbi:hypothetical protein D3C75_965620 [compost metagenome]
MGRDIRQPVTECGRPRIGNINSVVQDHAVDNIQDGRCFQQHPVAPFDGQQNLNHRHCCKRQQYSGSSRVQPERLCEGQPLQSN